MYKSWLEFEQKLKSSDSHPCNDLNKPAADIEIQNLENAINVVLPEDFTECLKIHNGQKGNAYGVFKGLQFLSCESIATEWQIWKQLFDNNEFINHSAEPDQGIAETWWHPMWIPFTSDGFGNHLCIDLAPTSEGKSGQIISLFHDEPVREIQADSFSEWLASLI